MAGEVGSNSSFGEFSDAEDDDGDDVDVGDTAGGDIGWYRGGDGLVGSSISMLIRRPPFRAMSVSRPSFHFLSGDDLFGGGVLPGHFPASMTCCLVIR